MKRALLFLATIIFLHACGGDSTKANVSSQVGEAAVDSVLQNLMPSTNEEVKDPSESVSNATAAKENEVQQTVENKTKYTIKPAMTNKLSDSLAQVKIQSSPNLGKNCEDLVVTFNDLVDKMLNNPSKEVIDQFSKFIADPFHLNCKKVNEKYKMEISKIEAKLETEDDDEY